jgi:predicted secreted protein
MTLLGSVAIYFVIWWLCLFVILPFGVKSQHEADDVTLGTEHGAPDRPHLVAKALATTLLAAIIFAGVYLYFAVYDKRLEDLLP